MMHNCLPDADKKQLAEWTENNYTVTDYRDDDTPDPENDVAYEDPFYRRSRHMTRPSLAQPDDTDDEDSSDAEDMDFDLYSSSSEIEEDNSDIEEDQLTDEEIDLQAISGPSEVSLNSPEPISLANRS